MKFQTHINAALICMGIVLAGIVQAAVPYKINYQGVLKDDNGVKIDGTVDIDLRLLPLGGGDAVFSESHAGVSVVGGLFSLKIGGVNDMSSVSFDAAYELELTVGGELMVPNIPLCSAPYALGVAGGAQGPQGKVGPAGADGATGEDGAAGAQGDPGPVGSEFWDGDLAGDIYKVNSGNVGIGTTTPTGLLHISGSEPAAIKLSGTRPGYGPRDYLLSLQAGNLSTGDPGMRLQTVDATAGLIRTILDSQGFFGIGEPTPAVRLHVNESPNGAGSLGALFRITGYEPRMEIEATRNGTTWNIGANFSGTDDNAMRLVIGNSVGGTAMVINQPGRVGIGMETPVAKLHVMEEPENSGEQGLLFRLSGREPRMELEAQRNGVIYSIAANMTGEDDHGMRLRIGNSDSGTALTINQPGRIGIGTDVPMGGLLHIDGSAGGTLLRLSGSEPAAIKLSGTRPGYGPRDYLFALQAGALSNGDPGMRLQTVDATAGLIRTILDSQGFFGIGELTPHVRLHVHEAPNGAGELGALFRITGYEPSMQIEATRNGTTWNIGANMSGTADNGMRLMIGNSHMGTAMAINQAGRVGIGQDLPVAKLHVQEVPENSGEQGLLFRITGREPTMQLEALRTGTTWNIGANFSGTTDNGMRLVIGNSDFGTAMVINQAGRVGIGAENPSAKLEVAGQVKITGGGPAAGRVLTSDADGLATWESPGAGAQGPQGKQGADGTAGTAGAQGPAGPVGSEFWDGDVGGDINNVNTGSVSISPKLGIGYAVTPIHNTTLSVWQNGGTTQGNSRLVSLIDRDINPAAPYLEIGFGYEHSNPDRNMQPVVIGYEHTDFAGQGAGDFYIATRLINSGDVAPSERLRVTSSGNVGIGTTSPGQRLDVSGNIQASGALVVNNGAGGNWHYRLNGSTLEWFENQVIGRVNMSLTLGGQLAVFDGIQAGGSGYKINGDNGGAGNWDMKLGNGGDLVWYENATYGAERMRLKKNGNLGIANDNPGQMFQVAGAYCTGTQWVDVSTREAKKNIEPLSLDVALQTLTNLDPVTFEYKDAKTPDGHVGFIAEDVPEIVATPDRKGLVSMDIVGVLTAVVKEQQKQMEIMRAELTELKAIVQP